MAPLTFFFIFSGNSVGAGGSRRHTGGLLPFSSGTWGIEKEIENVKGIVPDLRSVSYAFFLHFLSKKEQGIFCVYMIYIFLK